MSSGCVIGRSTPRAVATHSKNNIAANAFGSPPRTCMLMRTRPEPWPLTLARPVRGWGSPWKCVKEKVIGPLMEAVRFKALKPPQSERSLRPQGVTSPLSVDMSAVRSWRPLTLPIKEAQTMAKDLAVKHIPSFKPRPIHEAETESKAPEVLYLIRRTGFRRVRSKDWIWFPAETWGAGLVSVLQKRNHTALTHPSSCNDKHYSLINSSSPAADVKTSFFSSKQKHDSRPLDLLIQSVRSWIQALTKLQIQPESCLLLHLHLLSPRNDTLAALNFISLISFTLKPTAAAPAWWRGVSLLWDHLWVNFFPLFQLETLQARA